jgi:hypothetical protein
LDVRRELFGSSRSRRLLGERSGGEPMRYALLIYSSLEAQAARPEAERRTIAPAVAEILERPNVTGWLRLADTESATTLHVGGGKTLVVDGPFVESKEYLAGFIVVEADDLDGALRIVEELQSTGRAGVAIEVRPVLE